MQMYLRVIYFQIIVRLHSTNVSGIESTPLEKLAFTALFCHETHKCPTGLCAELLNWIPPKSGSKCGESTNWKSLVSLVECGCHRVACWTACVKIFTELRSNLTKRCIRRYLVTDRRTNVATAYLFLLRKECQVSIIHNRNTFTVLAKKITRDQWRSSRDNEQQWSHIT
jgi:hypothetical protein